MISQLYSPFLPPKKPTTTQPQPSQETEETPIAVLEQEEDATASVLPRSASLTKPNPSWLEARSLGVLQPTGGTFQASTPLSTPLSTPASPADASLSHRLQTVEQYDKGLNAPAVLFDIAQTTQLLAPPPETKQQVWVYLKSIEQLSHSPAPQSPELKKSIETLLKQIATQLDAHVHHTLGKSEQNVVKEWLEALLQQPIAWQSDSQAFEVNPWQQAFGSEAPGVLGGGASQLQEAVSPATIPDELPPLTQALAPLWQAYKQAMQRHDYGQSYQRSNEALQQLNERQEEADAPRLRYQWERLAGKAALGKGQAGVVLNHVETALEIVSHPQTSHVSPKPLADQQRLWEEKAQLWATPLKRPARSGLAWLQVARLAGQQQQPTEQLKALQQAGQQFSKAQQWGEAYKVHQRVLPLAQQQGDSKAVVHTYESLLNVGQQLLETANVGGQASLLTVQQQRETYQAALLASKQLNDKTWYTDLLQRYGAFSLQQGQTQTAQRVLGLLTQSLAS
ncbi:MAG: hypothetical protein ACKO34_06735 [Vampirovibrionales bacterium]